MGATDNNGASVRTVREEVAELLGVTPDDVDPDADLIASGSRFDPHDVVVGAVA